MHTPKMILKEPAAISYYMAAGGHMYLILMVPTPMIILTCSYVYVYTYVGCNLCSESKFFQWKISMHEVFFRNGERCRNAATGASHCKET